MFLNHENTPQTKDEIQNTRKLVFHFLNVHDAHVLFISTILIHFLKVESK